MAVPRHLSPAAKRWFRAVSTLYELESHHFLLLTLACEAWDRCNAARRALDEEGTTYTDRHGQPRPRPEVAIERDSRIAFARLLRELDLDVNPPVEPKRPPPLQSNRGGDAGQAAPR
jgi:phage terminase small subunit